MTPLNFGPGLAPAFSVVDGLVYVAFGDRENDQDPGWLQLEVVTPQGAPVRSLKVPDGFFDSFPVFDGPWLVYRGGAGETYRTVALNVQTNQALLFEGSDAGNFGLAVNAALGLVAYQQEVGPTYSIWFGHLADGTSAPTALLGAPDGLDAIVSADQVTLRKDTRSSVPGMTYPVRRRDLVVGEGAQAGIVVGLDGEPQRVAFAGEDCPTPSCATDGTIYVVGAGGGPGVRALIASRAELLQELPLASAVAPYDRPFWCGYFYSYSDQYGDNPAAPGNCAIVVEAAAALRCPLPIIVPPGLIGSVASRWASVVAIYVASGDPAALQGGVTLARQLMADAGLPRRPVLALRDGWPGSVTDAEWVGMELYCDPAESIDAFLARIHAGVATFDALPANRSVFFVDQAYDRNGAEKDEAKLLALQAIWPEMARDGHCVGVGLFSDGRNGGTRTHEDLRPSHRAMVAAIPGVPAIVTISPTPQPEPVPPSTPTPDPVPSPKPTPAPAPAPSSPPFAALAAFHLGDNMQTERGGIVGPAGKFGRISAAEAGKGLFGWFPVHFDADSSDGDSEFELADAGVDGRFTVRHIATGAFFGMDLTKFSNDITKEFYGKPNDQGAGWYEMPFGFGPVPGNSAVLLIIPYEQNADNPQPFFSTGIAWVKK